MSLARKEGERWTPEKLEKIGIIKRYGYYEFHVTNKRYLDWLRGKIQGKAAPLGIPGKYGEKFYAGPVNVTARRYCKSHDAELEECAAETEEKSRCFKTNIYCPAFEFTINPVVWKNPPERAYKQGKP